MCLQKTPQHQIGLTAVKIYLSRVLHSQWGGDHLLCPQVSDWHLHRKQQEEEKSHKVLIFLPLMLLQYIYECHCTMGKLKNGVKSSQL